MFFIACGSWKQALFFTQIYYYEEGKEVSIVCPLSPQWHYNAANIKFPK